MPTVLSTERLILRHWRRTDRKGFADLNSDPEVMHYLPGPLTPNQSNELLDELTDVLARDRVGYLATVRRDTDEFIGFVGVARLAPQRLPEPFELEVGWRLTRPAWGFGFATEAARACLRLAETQHGYREVVGVTAHRNQRSRAVMHRLGMAYRMSLTFDSPDLAAGHPLRESVLYHLTLGRPQASAT